MKLMHESYTAYLKDPDYVHDEKQFLKQVEIASIAAFEAARSVHLGLDSTESGLR